MKLKLPASYIAYIELMRWDKPIGFFLLLWPTLMALWIASKGHPSHKILFIFILGAWVMRSAGCVINDILDRRFDPLVERTRQRPLASQKISLNAAFIVFLVLILLAFVLVLQLNLLTILLSFAALFLAAFYPLMKRLIHFPQAFLGLAFAWSIPMAFTATVENIPKEAWVLFFATVFWVLAYDTAYAMADKKDDLKIGIKSTAIFFKNYDGLFILISQLISLFLFVFLGFYLKLGALYYWSLIVALCLVFYQQRLIYHKDPQKCFKAFLNNNYWGGVVFLGLVGGQWTFV